MKQAKGNVVLMEIPIYPNNIYMAGSDGQIYSRKKYKSCDINTYVDWHPLKGSVTKKGYRVISMCYNNQKTTKSVHSLVCMAFHGKPPALSSQVRHLDGNPNNNCPENLAWGTQYENWEDRKAHGRGNEGEKHPMAKLSNKECQHLRWAIRIGLCSQRQAARVLKMSQGGIFSAINSRGGDF